MFSKYCPVCHESTPHKRQFGIGSLILFIVTCGLWILVLPLYPVRCSRCGSGSLRQAFAPSDQKPSRSQMASDAELAYADSLDSPQMALCPMCCEEIRVGALKCKHCGEVLEKPAAAILPLIEPTDAGNGEVQELSPPATPFWMQPRNQKLANYVFLGLLVALVALWLIALATR